MLTIDQRKWIAHRMVLASDVDACDATGIEPSAVGGWKLQPEFIAAMDKAADDILNAGMSYVEALVAKSAQRLDEALDACNFDGSPNHTIRKSTAELVFKTSGLLRNRTEISGPKGGPVPIQNSTTSSMSAMSDEELDQLAALLEKTSK
jgi:hypothetical protein